MSKKTVKTLSALKYSILLIMYQDGYVVYSEGKCKAVGAKDNIEFSQYVLNKLIKSNLIEPYYKDNTHYVLTSKGRRVASNHEKQILSTQNS